MIETSPNVYWPKEKVGQIVNYDLQPINKVEDVYKGEFILIEINTPLDFKEAAEDVDFDFETCFGWGGFYPDTQNWSEDKKIVPYKFSPATHYKIWMGGLYKYKGQFYGYTYWT